MTSVGSSSQYLSSSRKKNSQTNFNKKNFTTFYISSSWLFLYFDEEFIVFALVTNLLSFTSANQDFLIFNLLAAVCIVIKQLVLRIIYIDFSFLGLETVCTRLWFLLKCTPSKYLNLYIYLFNVALGFA